MAHMLTEDKTHPLTFNFTVDNPSWIGYHDTTIDSRLETS